MILLGSTYIRPRKHARRIALCTAVLVSTLVASASAQEQNKSEPRFVARGNFDSPQYSPDGKTLLVTSPRQHGLVLIETTSGHATMLLEEPRVGVHAHFLASGDIAFRANRAGAMRTLAMSLNGRATIQKEERSLAFAHNDRIYVRTGAVLEQVGSGDRFFSPTVSPDQSKIAFVGLATGIYVYEFASQHLTHVGPGTAPSWSPNSEQLVYEWTQDDGHTIVSSDLWLWNASEGSTPITSSDARDERHPSFSPDGKCIAFDDNQGGIYIMSTQVRP